MAKVTIEQAWSVLIEAVAAAQPTGQIVIGTGKNTGLFVRVDPTKLPATIALDLVEQGIRKPLTDISLDAKSDEGNWKHPHQRRLDRVERWYKGEFSARGGAADEVGSQMKVELTEELKSKGLNPKAEAHKAFFTGGVMTMIDSLEAAGLVADREALVQRMRDQAVAKLAKRGEAAAAVDLSGIKL